MSQTGITKNVLIGLPESGKSTFIAALWEVVRAFTIPDTLHFVSLDGDDVYLNKIHESWVLGKPLERTKVESSIPVTITLRGSLSNSEITKLVLPDLDGELIKRQWVKREWTSDYQENLQDSAGILLFVSARNLREGTLLDTTQDDLAHMITPTATTQTGAEASNARADPRPLDFDADKVPTQTILVELLQFIANWGEQSKTWRVAIIVSAWDLAEKQSPDKTPTDWIKQKLPLLSQFLLANPELFAFHVYGVSAQGGELDDHETRNKLIRLQYPAERIRVVDGANVTHNITLPIKWLMG